MDDRVTLCLSLYMADLKSRLWQTFISHWSYRSKYHLSYNFISLDLFHTMGNILSKRYLTISKYVFRCSLSSVHLGLLASLPPSPRDASTAINPSTKSSPGPANLQAQLHVPYHLIHADGQSAGVLTGATLK